MEKLARGVAMHEREKDELLAKLDLIEEQAQLTLREYPRELRRERQRMIIALVKHIRAAATDPQVSLLADPEATVKLRHS